MREIKICTMADAFSLIVADVYIRHPRIIKKAELKNRTLTSSFGG